MRAMANSLLIVRKICSLADHVTLILLRYITAAAEEMDESGGVRFVYFIFFPFGLVLSRMTFSSVKCISQSIVNLPIAVCPFCLLLTLYWIKTGLESTQGG